MQALAHDKWNLKADVDNATKKETRDAVEY